MYQTYLLDIDNTLLDFDAAEERCFQNMIESYSIKYEKEMLLQYKKINRGLWDLLEQGKITKDTLLNTRFTKFFNACHLEADGVEAELRYREELGKSADLIPHAKETLIQLKNMGKSLYTASNGVFSTQIQRLEAAGILSLFDGMFISETIGYEKPAAGFFEYCFSHIPGFEKEKALMVGDSISSDIQGAKNAGLDSCLLSAHASAASFATHTIGDISQLVYL